MIKDPLEVYFKIWFARTLVGHALPWRCIHVPELVEDVIHATKRQTHGSAEPAQHHAFQIAVGPFFFLRDANPRRMANAFFFLFLVLGHSVRVGVPSDTGRQPSHNGRWQFLVSCL